MNALHRLSFAVPALALMVLAACGGGGGSSSTPSITLPTSVPTAKSTGNGQATFRIDTGGVTASSSARRTQYVSPSTLSATIANGSTTIATLNITPSSAGCTTTASGSTSCVFTLAVPAGPQTFTINTYSQVNAGGSLLSTATVSFTIVQNSTNTIPLTLNGVVASARVVLDATSFAAGTPASTIVHVNAYDAAGNIIVGAGDYSTPITLTDSDTTGATQLSVSPSGTTQAARRTSATNPTATLNAPSQTVTLSYNGSSFTGATVAASGSFPTVSSPSFAAAGSASTEYALSAPDSLDAIAAGNDGKMWFASYGLIGSVATNGTGETDFTTGLPTDDFYSLAAGPAGTMWYGGYNGNLGSISTSGSVAPIVSDAALPSGCAGGSSRTAGSLVRRTGQDTRRVTVLSTPSPSPAMPTACGAINWMALGPDGNVWFSDDDGEIGRIMPDHTAEEWDITTLKGYPQGAYYPEPEQFAFGTDGALYVNDEWNGQVVQITIAGGAPQSAAAVSTGDCGGYALAIGPDNNIYAAADASDGCGSYVTVFPTGSSFSTSSPQYFEMTSIDNNNNGGAFYQFASSPGGIWAVDSSSSMYRITNVATSGSIAPIVTTLTPFTKGGSPYIVTLGPDLNMWSREGVSPDYLVKIMYGSATIGSTQSFKRLTVTNVHQHAAAKGLRKNGAGRGRGATSKAAKARASGILTITQ